MRIKLHNSLAKSKHEYFNVNDIIVRLYSKECLFITFFKISWARFDSRIPKPYDFVNTMSNEEYEDKEIFNLAKFKWNFIYKKNQEEIG